MKMITIFELSIHSAPRLAIICGVSGSREYLWRRCQAEMRIEFAGLPVEFVTGYLDDEEWNEPKCKNAAAHATMSQILLFTNADIFIPRGIVETILQLNALDHWMAIAQRIDEQSNGEMIFHEYAIGDCQAVPQQVFCKTTGFDERMTGWGYLDYDFMKRCEKIGAKIIRIPNMRVIHRWHPRLNDEEYCAMNKRNEKIALGEIA